MGLLDEAIREHLELKRRRGADPSEIARQEHEALGPARRSSEDSADAPPPATSSVAVAEPGRTPEPYVAGDGEPAGAVPFETRPQATGEPAPEFAPESAAAAPPAPEPESRFAPEPPAAESPTPEPPAPERGATAEMSAAEVAEALGQPDAGDPSREPSEGDGEEDLLEETPEFLQETPEHDRLWFEQKPPKDFDF